MLPADFQVLVVALVEVSLWMGLVGGMLALGLWAAIGAAIRLGADLLERRADRKADQQAALARRNYGELFDEQP